MRLRDLTAADMKIFAPSMPYRVRGVAGVEDDGRVLGVGGLAYLPDGRVFAFSYFGPEATKYPIALHKTALMVIGLARASGVRELYACPELRRSPAAERWLKRLGFEPCQEGWWCRNVGA